MNTENDKPKKKKIKPIKRPKPGHLKKQQVKRRPESISRQEQVKRKPPSGNIPSRKQTAESGQ